MAKTEYRKTKKKPQLKTGRVVLTIVMSATLVSAVIYFWQPMMDLLTRTDRLKELVHDAGIWGPIIFIAVQFLQILIAPIPGQVIGFASGALFGVWLGALYALIGSVLGMTFVIWLARRFGRPLVERFFDKKLIGKFDYITNNNGPVVFFFIMLLPVFPDDLVCYLVGLSKIPIKTLVAVGVLGRAPTTIGSALIGAGVAGANVKLVVGVSIVFAVALAIGYWKRASLERWVKSISGKNFGRD